MGIEERRAGVFIAEAQKRLAKGAMVLPQTEGFDISRLAFPRQRAAIDDPVRSVAICCGRQSGKTQAAAWRHTDKALKNPGSLQVFIAPTRGWAKRIIWKTLTDLNDQHGLGAKPSISDLSMRYRNGAIVALMGADKDTERAKIRGIHPIDITIDEAQSFPFWLHEFIKEDVRPTQRNVRGRLTVQGTPPVSLEHPWFKNVWQSKTYSKHSWNITHWPKALYKQMFGQTAAQALAEDLKDRGVDENDVTFRREMLGEFLADESALAYRFDQTKNLWLTVPQIDHTTIGVDLGWGDASAVEEIGWADGAPTCYQLDEEIHEGINLIELAVILKRFAARRMPAVCMVDSGGNRQGYETIKEILTREGVPMRLERRPVLPVADQVGLVNHALQAGRLKLKEGTRAASDMRLVTWNKGIAGTTLDAGFHSDAIPGITYAYQAAVPLLPSPPEPETESAPMVYPKGFDPEQWAAQAASNRPWWEIAERGNNDSGNPFFDE